MLTLLIIWGVDSASGSTLSDVDERREWYVGAIEIEGNEDFSDDELINAISTKQRQWYALWRARPAFDPISFETDLQRLQRFYEARGYYDVAVTYDLEVHPDDDLIDIHLDIVENAPVTVVDVSIDAGGYQAQPSDARLTDVLQIKAGDQFDEKSYQQGEEAIRTFFLERGYAWVGVVRRARVDVEARVVSIWYTVDLGPECVFGETRIEGTEHVDPELIRRDIAYRACESFSVSPIIKTRTQVLALGLFQSVEIAADSAARGDTVVPMVVKVVEGPQRSIKLGVIYNTQDQIGGQAEWEHRNWLGGGRRLTLSGKLTQFNSFVSAKLVQPHFLDDRTTGILQFRQDVDNESTYLLNASQLRPRLERSLVSHLSGFVSYRAEYNALSSVDQSVVDALGGVRRDGVLSGPQLGLVWNSTVDPLDPQQGEIVSATAEQPGGIWGGDFNFWKVAIEGRKYVGIGWETVLATRLRLGFSDAMGNEENLPLFDRFYAGGENSVRGYARRMLGPLSPTGKPLGGLTLIEGSVELRRPIYKALGGVVFVDFGQVSLSAFDVPIGSLKFATGPGITLDTPVGPLALFVGFPIDPPAGERRWQLQFSVGQFF